MFGLPDLLCPERCAGCNQLARSGLCLACLDGLPRIGHEVCTYCGRPSPRAVDSCSDCRNRNFDFDAARQAVEFKQVVRTAIHRFKYSGNRSLGGPMAGLITELIDPGSYSPQAVTWIVPSPEGLRRTGIDHGKVLAELVAQRLGVPAVPLARRVRRTLPQMRLDPEARRTNLVGAFQATICPPERVLVVDDVFTTGSTASEMARALKASGSREVIVLSAARSFAAGRPDL